MFLIRHLIIFVFYYFILLYPVVIYSARTKRLHVSRGVDRRLLPKLYTYIPKIKKYKPILNVDGRVTKRYPRGIYLEEFRTETTPRYKNIHKRCEICG